MADMLDMPVNSDDSHRGCTYPNMATAIMDNPSITCNIPASI